MIARAASQFSGVASSIVDSTNSVARTSSTQSQGTATLLIASGRGGSGTTLISALLAVCAAGDGLRVLLVDADDFVGPLSMILGAHPRAGWQDLRGGHVSPADITTEVSTTLTLIAGGAPRVNATSAALSSANATQLSNAERRSCMRRISTLGLGYDLVIIDCGSRLDVLSAAIMPHANERLIAITAGDDSVALAATFALCKAARLRHGALPLDLIVNRHDTHGAVACFNAIDAGVRQFLTSSLRFAGAIPLDTTLDAAIRAGMNFSDAAAGSPAANAAHDAVTQTIRSFQHLLPGV